MKGLFIIFLFLSLGCRSQVPAFHQYNVPTDAAHCPPSDTDAAAWITATGITEPAICKAVNEMVLAYKAASLWTKRTAIYLFIGGSINTVKYNLKDPQNTDAAFRLTQSGTVNYFKNGVSFNGTSGYFNSHVNATSDLTQYNVSLGFYSLSNIAETSVQIGANVTGGPTNDAGYPFHGLRIRYPTDDKTRSYAYGGYNVFDGALGAVNTNSRGLSAGVRTSTTSNKVYYNGVQSGSTNTTTATNTRPNYKIYIGASNTNGSPANYGTHTALGAFIGDGVTDAEAANEFTIWQNFKRNIEQLNQLTNFNGVSQSSGAAVFNKAVHRYLACPADTSLEIRTGFTGLAISSWAKLYSLSAPSIFAGIDDGQTTAGTSYLMGYYPAYGSFVFQIETNTTTRYIVSSIGTPSINVWYYIQGWYDQANTKVFIRVNNTVDSLDFAETTFHAAGKTPFAIGAAANNDTTLTLGWMDGELKNVRLFKRPITAAESTYFYNSGTPLTYAELSNTLKTDPLFISSWDFENPLDLGKDNRQR